jgi:hypothetical protein
MPEFFTFGRTVYLSLPVRTTAFKADFFTFGKTVYLSLPVLLDRFGRSCRSVFCLSSTKQQSFIILKILQHTFWYVKLSANIPKGMFKPRNISKNSIVSCLMKKTIMKKMLNRMSKKYSYDIGYLQSIFDASNTAFLKFMAFQTMSSHTGNLSLDEFYAVKLRTLIWEDCGPCTQLYINMALEANVSPTTIQAIIENDLEKLSDKLVLLVKYTDAVLMQSPQANDLRQQAVKHWGPKGLVAIAFGISSSRVYPTLKYALGYGAECQKVSIKDINLFPVKASKRSMTQNQASTIRSSS